MRQALAAVLVALAAGCGDAEAPAELAVYEAEADLRRAPGGAIRCEAPLPCRGERFAPTAEPAVTEADVLAARAPTPETLVLGLTAGGSSRLDRLLASAAERGRHLALVVDGEVLAYVAVDPGVSSAAGVQIATPRAKEIARRLD